MEIWCFSSSLGYKILRIPTHRSSETLSKKIHPKIESNTTLKIRREFSLNVIHLLPRNASCLLTGGNGIMNIRYVDITLPGWRNCHQSGFGL